MSAHKLTWLFALSATAVLATGCIDDKSDSSDDGGSTIDLGDSDTDTDADSDTDADVDSWSGQKEVYIIADGYGDLCDIIWNTSGTPASSGCPACDFTFDVTGTNGTDSVGSCGDQANIDFTIGYAPGYYSGYDVMVVDYNNSWYPAYLAQLSGSDLYYYNAFQNTGTYYTYTYYLIGNATVR